MVSVILLEDEPVLRSELAGYLTECGHRTDAVGTLAEFRQVFSPCDHAIAVIDLGLPDGDGIDLIDWLRAHGRRLGIIVVSARSSTAERVRGLMIGADHYLGKPFDLEELAATVAALGRRLAAGASARAGSWMSGGARFSRLVRPLSALPHKRSLSCAPLPQDAGRPSTGARSSTPSPKTTISMTSAAWIRMCINCARRYKRPQAWNSPSARLAGEGISFSAKSTSSSHDAVNFQLSAASHSPGGSQNSSESRGLPGIIMQRKCRDGASHIVVARICRASGDRGTPAAARCSGRPRPGPMR